MRNLRFGHEQQQNERGDCIRETREGGEHIQIWHGQRNCQRYTARTRETAEMEWLGIQWLEIHAHRWKCNGFFRRKSVSHCNWFVRLCDVIQWLFSHLLVTQSVIWNCRTSSNGFRTYSIWICQCDTFQNRYRPSIPSHLCRKHSSTTSNHTKSFTR